MVAGAVAVGAGFVVRETADDLEIVLEWRERLEDVWKLVIRTHTLRRPVFHVRPVRNVDEGHAAREGLVGFGRARGQHFRGRQHGFEHRQGDDCSQSF